MIVVSLVGHPQRPLSCYTMFGCVYDDIKFACTLKEFPSLDFELFFICRDLKIENFLLDVEDNLKIVGEVLQDICYLSLHILFNS